MRDKDDPTEELGSQLSPSERITRVLAEIGGLDPKVAFGVTAWEMTWLKDVGAQNWRNFTPRMEAVMQKIENKVFGEEPQSLSRPYESVEPRTEEGRRELDGQLKFKK